MDGDGVSGWRLRAAMWLVVAAGPVAGQPSALPAPRAGTPPASRATAVPAASARASESPVFDQRQADEARQRNEPTYVESITVLGYDPDVRRVPRKTLERRFAETLLAPPSAPMAGMRMLDTTPCMSLASTWNNIGSSFVPVSGCPR